MGGKPRKNDPKPRKRGRGTSKIPVVAVIERGGRVVASPAANVDADNLKGAIRAYCDPSARIVTDELVLYRGIGREFKGGHHTVNHCSEEYARREENGVVVHTNTAEGFFSLLKRGIFGIHHLVSPKHLWRYVDEAAWKYSYQGIDDGERLQVLMQGMEGKKLANRKSAPL